MDAGNFLKNEKGVFKNVTPNSGIADQIGWWTSIVSGDFDNDGDIDYVVGNLGQNSFYKASQKYPVSVYASDFDGDKSYDAFLSLYLPSSQNDTSKKEFPANSRDEIIDQMIRMRTKFPNYKSYANITVDSLFTKEQLQKALVLKANNFNSCFCRNDGGGKFTLISLPFTAQLSALNGMIADDFDGDGNLDIAINTNDFGANVAAGRYDALNGLVLKGNGKGAFVAQTILESGIFIPGDGKAFVKLRSKNNKYLLAASQNRGSLKVFKLKKDDTNIPLQSTDISAAIVYKNGQKQKREFYYGSSFLSQSARFLSIDKDVSSVMITDTFGKTRTIRF